MQRQEDRDEPPRYGPAPGCMDNPHPGLTNFPHLPLGKLTTSTNFMKASSAYQPPQSQLCPLAQVSLS